MIELGHFAVLSVLLFRLRKGSDLRHEYQVVVVPLALSQESLGWDLNVNLITAVVNSNHLIRLIAVFIHLVLLSWRGFYHLR